MENRKARISVQVDKSVADNAEAILDMLGLTPTIALTIFYKRIASTGQLPFEISESEYKENKVNDKGGVENG